MRILLLLAVALLVGAIAEMMTNGPHGPVYSLACYGSGCLK